jgi:hypothetical protein
MCALAWPNPPGARRSGAPSPAGVHGVGSPTTAGRDASPTQRRAPASAPDPTAFSSRPKHAGATSPVQRTSRTGRPPTPRAICTSPRPRLDVKSDASSRRAPSIAGWRMQQTSTLTGSCVPASCIPTSTRPRSQRTCTRARERSVSGSRSTWTGRSRSRHAAGSAPRSRSACAPAWASCARCIQSHPPQRANHAHGGSTRPGPDWISSTTRPRAGRREGSTSARTTSPGTVKGTNSARRSPPASKCATPSPPGARDAIVASTRSRCMRAPWHIPNGRIRANRRRARTLRWDRRARDRSR